jgi:hypothetical protein
VQDEPLDAVNLSPTSAAPPPFLPETSFAAGTILSCPACGEGLYKLTARATTADLALDDGALLIPLNTAISARAVWKPFACPFCDARLVKDGQLHTLSHGWK